MLTRNKKTKLAVSLAVALALGSLEANAGIILGADLAKLTVFSNTYTTTGDSAIIHGSVLVGTVATTGANAAVNGDVTSVGAANIGGGTATVAKVAGSGALVTGSVISNGVLTIGGATGLGPIGPIISGSIISTGASTIGAFSEVGGNMLSGGVATTGANSLVKGDVLSTGAATTGANSKVDGNVISTGAATTGANSIVTGDLRSTAAVSQGASSTVGGTVLASTAVSTTPDLSAVRTTVTTEANQVNTAKGVLTAKGGGTNLDTNANFNVAATGIDMFKDTTLLAGVYSSTGFLTTTASTTLTLDGQGLDNQEWVFNIGSYLTTGASTTIEVVNVGINASVYWNTVGYAALGAGTATQQANFVGTVLANTYVSVGANTTVNDIGTSCGAVYSETSFVSTGAGAVIGGNGCAAVSTKPPVTSVPEPESFGMLLAALALFGFKRSRKA
jgi:predicted acyltransferase (DUF342 family)